MQGTQFLTKSKADSRVNVSRISPLFENLLGTFFMGNKLPVCLHDVIVRIRSVRYS